MPRILICADGAAQVQQLQRLLQEADHAVSVHNINAVLPGPLAEYDLIVVEGSRCEAVALRFCRQLRAQLGARLVPILYITDNQATSSQMSSLENGADTYLVYPFSAAELLAQVRAFVRLKRLHDDLLEKTEEIQQINKRLQAAHQQINCELELARRIQLSFLPQALPDLPPRTNPPGWGIRFAVHYALCGRVGGDFYDVFRLDEEHIGLYVADAMGHGVPASLLTVFVKKAVRTKEIIGQRYRLIPPDEVLRQLNRELIGEALADHPFITMTYALCNFRTGLFQFARAGHPYPLYLPRRSAPELWQVDGSLLGIFESRFPVQTHRLQPGDKILLYTDGIDAASYPGHPPGGKSLVACAAAHTQLPVEPFVKQLAHELFREAAPQDDLTLLGLEVYDEPPAKGESPA